MQLGQDTLAYVRTVCQTILLTVPKAIVHCQVTTAFPHPLTLLPIEVKYMRLAFIKHLPPIDWRQARFARPYSRGLLEKAARSQDLNAGQRDRSKLHYRTWHPRAAGYPASPFAQCQPSAGLLPLQADTMTCGAWPACRGVGDPPNCNTLFAPGLVQPEFCTTCFKFQAG